MVTGGKDGCNYRATGTFAYDNETCFLSVVDGDGCEQVAGGGKDCPDADCSVLPSSGNVSNSMCMPGNSSLSCASCNVPFSMKYAGEYEDIPYTLTVSFNADKTVVAVGGAEGCNYRCNSTYSYDTVNCAVSLTASGWTGQRTSGNSDCPSAGDICTVEFTSQPVGNDYCNSGASLIASFFTLIGGFMAYSLIN